MFNLEVFQSRLNSFPDEYMNNFNYIWKRKIEIEGIANSSVLDDRHRDETYRRLCLILPKWQTYRPLDNNPCLATLKKSLSNISEAYNQLRKHTLLDFENIPNKALESVWHELGRAKENDGEANDYGLYSVISVCKPLLLFWGQTPAFDSKVRKSMPQEYRIDKYSGNWNLQEWKRVMSQLSRELNEDKDAIEFMKKRTLELYGKNSIIPYGRFIDIYYFEGA
jgi:hypothetical protein